METTTVPQQLCQTYDILKLNTIKSLELKPGTVDSEGQRIQNSTDRGACRKIICCQRVKRISKTELSCPVFGYTGIRSSTIIDFILKIGTVHSRKKFQYIINYIIPISYIVGTSIAI